ncbi:MAG: hypothetical protein KDI06_05280 [Calditrichaeota bacterium]|nr:hypothetical protein [Calditrichota bacterium]
MSKLPSNMLLCFAHKGEARSFLKHYPFQPVAFPVEGLYRCEASLLLITGEGLQRTSEKLGAVLGGFYREIREIVNLGIAGALDERAKPGEVLSIRTCYGEGQNGPLFHSFTSRDGHATVDCISSVERVEDPEAAQRLAPFAPLVDRELWSIGSLAKRFALPFRSLKLVADRAGVDTREVCATLRLEDPGIPLLQAFRETFAGIVEDPAPVLAAENPLGPGFYCTASQQRRLESMLKALALKGGEENLAILKKAGIGEIRQRPIAPKARTQALLENLHALLNPFESRLRGILEEMVQPLAEAGFEVRFSPHLEQDWLEIKALLHNSGQTRKLGEALQRFTLEEIQALLNGDPQIYKKVDSSQ